MICVICNRMPDRDTAGFRFRPVTFFVGVKSQQLIPEDDKFPNLDDEKFVCFDCTPNELLEALGFDVFP